mgnify:CR=1 FL=1
MIRLTHCITAINEWSGPALTQYGQERVELGGPVVSRWLSKIANYLTNELAADLFGTGEPTPTRIYTTLQPWQDTLWQIAARAMGWELLDTRRPLPGDLFVTNILGSEASDAIEAGAHVLAQPARYLSFAWDGPLGGALDGLADGVEVDALNVQGRLRRAVVHVEPSERIVRDLPSRCNRRVKEDRVEGERNLVDLDQP